MSKKHRSKLRLHTKVRKAIKIGNASSDPLARKVADVMSMLVKLPRKQRPK